MIRLQASRKEKAATVQEKSTSAVIWGTWISSRTDQTGHRDGIRLRQVTAQAKKRVCIDSPHNGGGRQLHLIDIRGLIFTP